MSTHEVTVEIRQWGYFTFAAYVFDGDPYGRFVGTATTRCEAAALGSRLRSVAGKSCGATESARVDARVEHPSVKGLREAGRSRSVPTTRVARPTTASPSARPERSAVL